MTLVVARGSSIEEGAQPFSLGFNSLAYSRT